MCPSKNHKSPAPHFKDTINKKNGEPNIKKGQKSGLACNHWNLYPRDVELIKEVGEWLSYNLPKNLLGKIWKGKFGGQKQKWFIMKFLGEDKDININTKNPEFLDWKWIEPSKLPEVAVDFKIDIYKKIKEELINLI